MPRYAGYALGYCQCPLLLATPINTAHAHESRLRPVLQPMPLISGSPVVSANVRSIWLRPYDLSIPLMSGYAPMARPIPCYLAPSAARGR